ncbi:neuronal acetylcholine receptor subunit alpha-10-like [Paramacrobiotus metropolitanus]|uniref:neuronal acetylcholine receptor subunit alpha-10-like n=1 Tax=Paramacrobiotus metropolitanus TaxID=2943436 RepID=UPI0024465BB0|nr:neuronal acetylcholine receptor subunit alpha-10-like [Paramacrobiotus metropolitanus]
MFWTMQWPLCSVLAVIGWLPFGYALIPNSDDKRAPTVESFSGSWMAESQLPKRSLSNEESLFRSLFQEYNKNIRANYNTTESLKVELGMTIRRIEYLDEKRQTLLFHATTRMRWKDPRLTWEPAKFDQVQNVAYSSFALWIPDIQLNNEADAFGSKNFEHVLAHIYYDGQVMLSSPSAFKIYCGMDFGKWPYDEQMCVIEFESFTNDGTIVDLQTMGGDDRAIQVSNFSSCNEWRIVAVRADKQIKSYECCQGAFHSVYFSITLQRKENLYGTLLLGPLITMLIASWILFLLPFENSGKFIFGGLQLVFVGVFAIFLKHILPPSINQVPYIATLTLNTMVLILTAIFLQLLLQWISRLKSRMPSSLRTFLLEGMGRACCLVPLSGYTKPPTVHVSTSEQEVDHFELEDASASILSDKNRQEWSILAKLLNRVTFVMYAVISLVMLY